VELIGALVVLSSFHQTKVRLQEISREFYAESRVPVTFMTAQTLGEIVTILSERPDARNGILWSRLLSGTVVSVDEFNGQLRDLDSERVSRGG